MSLRWCGRAAAVLAVAWTVGASLRISSYARRTSAARSDAAIVLGAAIRKERPSRVFAERINHAVRLFEAHQVGCIVFTGGVGYGAQLAESDVARRYAIRRGVPPSCIYVDTTSRNTRENILQAKRILDRHGLRNALLVSDPLHMKRAVTIARDVGLAVRPSPTRTSQYASPITKLLFLVRESWSYAAYLVRRTLWGRR